MRRYSSFQLAALFVVGLICRLAVADAYDPPATYYNTATGTGATLKQQLHDIIDNHTSFSYNSANANLQITDAAPNQPGYMVAVYDRTLIHVAAINPNGSPPGWDSGATWNKEHTWPKSRGPGDTGPDETDLFELRPAISANNSARGNLNYGGAYGLGTPKVVTDGGSKWYPGDLEAGTIARQEFYMAVRYDGSDANTTNLELFAGDPSTSQGLGDLNRMIEWNYAVAPDEFERRRNQIIYNQFQHNRNPFTDRPEYAWSIFVNQTNNSQLAINGATVNADGSSTRNVDLGRVFVGAAVPAAQAFTLNKSGTNGTYFQVTTSGSATSSLSGRFNNMRTNQTDSKAITVGLDSANTTTASAGLKSGSVTIDNLDITTGGGAGKGGNDANDTFNVSLTVLDHARPSFGSGSLVTALSHDFGTIPAGSTSPSFSFDIYNLLATAGYTANMDFDSITPSGDSSAFTTNLAASAGSLVLAGGASQTFTAALTAATVGTFSASYVLNFSDENIAGALNKSITLTLTGATQLTQLAGDYNGDLIVDAADYSVWRATAGQSVTPNSGADGDGNGLIDDGDYNLWRSNFGQAALGSGRAASVGAAVPEPAMITLAVAAVTGVLGRRKVRLPGRNLLLAP
ncbi:MAG: endonuclease [Pirellulales bacterium]